MCVTVDLQGPTALKSHVPTSAGINTKSSVPALVGT